MLLATVPKIISRTFPSFIWNIPEKERIVYLTFDDGPIPQTTPWLLNLLNQYQAKASFFCVGENVRKYPHLYNSLLFEGHTVGNHTYNHLVGWKTSVHDYIDNVNKAKSLIDSELFRPPHGLIKNGQFQILKNEFKVVMWDVLSMDYDKKVRPEQCYRNVIENVKPGSIVVFHDSIKAWKNVSYALPKTLDTLKKAGFEFHAIKSENISLQKPGIIENWMNSGFLRKRA
jgi:peptidoglycan-N-acetylglucosamine deacetylase